MRRVWLLRSACVELCKNFYTMMDDKVPLTKCVAHYDAIGEVRKALSKCGTRVRTFKIIEGIVVHTSTWTEGQGCVSECAVVGVPTLCSDDDVVPLTASITHKSTTPKGTVITTLPPRGDFVLTFLVDETTTEHTSTWVEGGDHKFFDDDRLSKKVTRKGVVFTYTGERGSEALNTATTVEGTSTYKGTRGTERLVYYKTPNETEFFFQGERGSEHIVRKRSQSGTHYLTGPRRQERVMRVVCPEGSQTFYKGAKNEERVVRVIRPNNSVLFYSGASGNERVVRAIRNQSSTFFYAGNRGSERVVRCVLENGAILLYSGEKGKETVDKVSVKNVKNQLIARVKKRARSALDEMETLLEGEHMNEHAYNCLAKRLKVVYDVCKPE